MEIVLVGRSNVGKSSVIRKLTGKPARIGKYPGVTRKPLRYSCGKLEIVDMPGFGFMTGLSRRKQERIKTGMIRYLEQNCEKILLALEVLDVRAFGEIVERWSQRGQIPLDIEMFQFLEELGLQPIIVANKIDLIYSEDRDRVLDDICEKFGLFPPWRQWKDVIVPFSGKTGEGLKDLIGLIHKRLIDRGRQDLTSHLKLK